MASGKGNFSICITNNHMLTVELPPHSRAQQGVPLLHEQKVLPSRKPDQPGSSLYSKAEP